MNASMFPKKKRKRKPSKRWFGKKPRKEGWEEARKKAVKPTCEVSGEPTLIVWQESDGNKRMENIAHVDHIVCERMILALCPEMDPHHEINLMSLSRKFHGIKTSADRLLCRGDKLRFLQILNQHGWPMERVHSALEFYGFEKKVQPVV